MFLYMDACRNRPVTLGVSGQCSPRVVTSGSSFVLILFLISMLKDFKVGTFSFFGEYILFWAITSASPFYSYH